MENYEENYEFGDDPEEIDAKIKELQAKKVRAGSGKKNKREIAATYHSFMNAKTIYENYGLSLHRHQSPRYFYKLQTNKIDKRGNNIRVQDISYFSHQGLYPNFVELESDASKKYLRKMLEGGTMSVQTPQGEIVEYNFERRIYDKLTNTQHQVDEKTFNLVDLSGRLLPREHDEIIEYPAIYKALLFAITGNVIHFDKQINQWVGDKPDTLVWFKKWLYGAVCANIGDNSMSMPVIFGSGKVGKNALFDIIFRQILGTWACFSSTWDVVDGNFNSFKLGKVFMFIDEIPPREEWSKVKNMTGSPVSFIKEKYGPEFEVDNCIVNALGSNSTTYPLPWEDGEQMMRVSPIKTNIKSTFAENTVKILNQENEGLFDEPFVDALIRSSGNDPTTMSDFKKGDFVLRNLMSSDWQGKEGCQMLLDCLHQEFKGTTFQLSPLRSTDWEEIKATKINGVEIVIEMMAAHRPDVIIASELYEIYSTALSDTLKAKNRQNFLAEIKDRMIEMGYDYKRSPHLADGIRDNTFIKNDRSRRGNLLNYKPDYDRYVKTETVNGRQFKRLVWPDDQLDDHFDDMFQPKVSPKVKEVLNKRSR